ncbi:hypothetical protein JW899_02385 [Candidatus Uhrbacteria bacterium]|nr:hypothetical protein [Candidatus Uhrbacteria bacterium]
MSVSRKVLITLLISLAAIVSLAAFSYGRMLYRQEGSLTPFLSGIVRLGLGGQNIVSVPGTDNRYMTRSRDGREVLVRMMGERGYEFTEQLGAGYLFRDADGKWIVVTRRCYSGLYDLWWVTEMAAGGMD